MEDCTITLYDPENQENYELQLSAEDALRAQTDMSFASALLNVARQSINATTASQHTCFGASSSQLPTDDHTLISDQSTEESGVIGGEINGEIVPTVSEDSLGEGFRWSNSAVLLLLEEYRLREKDIFSGKLSQKKAWDQISKEMTEKGYDVSGRQCSTRLNTMKRTYKTIKDHNVKSGNNKRTWPYYDIMENLFGKKPYMAPVSTLSSTGAETSSSHSSLSTHTMAADDHIPRKCKMNDIATAIRESRAFAEEGRNRRHAENMEIKNKILDKLDILINKL